jgi:hypothetical protein
MIDRKQSTVKPRHSAAVRSLNFVTVFRAWRKTKVAYSREFLFTGLHGHQLTGVAIFGFDCTYKCVMETPRSDHMRATILIPSVMALQPACTELSTKKSPMFHKLKTMFIKTEN